MSVSDLILGKPGELVWNCTRREYWFHYTTPYAAETIYETGLYKATKERLWVTSSMPGALPDERLLRELFDSAEVRERLKAAVVMIRDADEFAFKREGKLRWWSDVGVGEVDLRAVLVGWCAVVGGEWRYHPALYQTK